MFPGVTASLVFAQVCPPLSSVLLLNVVNTEEQEQV